MNTFYARKKDNIVLDIEKYPYAFYAKIDFRKALSFGLCLKKHIYPYNQFDFMHEDKSLSLYAHPDKNPFIANFINEIMNDHTINMENWCVYF